jgi:hypothetical protein
LKREELGPKPDQRFYPQKTNLILELKPRVFSSLNNEMELGLRVLLKSKNPTTLVRTKDLKAGHFKNSGPALASCLELGSHSPK